MLYSNPKDLHAWLNQLRYDDLQRLAEKLGVNLPAVEGKELGMVTLGHIYKCQLRIMDQVDTHVDPGQWHLFLGCHYPPFKNDPPVSTSRFRFFSPVALFNRVVAPGAISAFNLPTLRLPSFTGDGNQEEIEAQVEVDCMMDLDNARVSVMDNEEGAVENETASIENLTGLQNDMTCHLFDRQEESAGVSAGVQVDDVGMICQDPVPVDSAIDANEAAPHSVVQGISSVPSPSGRPAGPVRSALKRYRSSCFNFKAAHQANKLAKGHVRDARVRFADTEAVSTSTTENNLTNDDPVENAGIVTSPKVTLNASSPTALTANKSHGFAMPAKLDSVTDNVGSMDMLYEPFNIVRDSNNPRKRTVKPKRISLKPKPRPINGPPASLPDREPSVLLTSKSNDLTQRGEEPVQSGSSSSSSFVHVKAAGATAHIPTPECLTLPSAGNNCNATSSMLEAFQPPTSSIPEPFDIVYEPFNIPQSLYFNKQKKQSSKPPRTRLGPKTSASKNVQHVPDRAVLQPLNFNVPANVCLQRYTSSHVNAPETEMKFIQPESSSVASLPTTIKEDGFNLADKKIAPPATVAGSLNTGYRPFDIPQSISKVGKRPDKPLRTKLGPSKSSSTVQSDCHLQIRGVLQPNNDNIPVSKASHSLPNSNDNPQAMIPTISTQNGCHTRGAAPAQTSTVDIPAPAVAENKFSPVIGTESEISHEEKDIRLVQVLKRNIGVVEEEDAEYAEYMIALPRKKSKLAASHDIDESSSMKETVPKLSLVCKSVGGKKVAVSAAQGTTKAIVKKAFKRKNIKQHPASSSVEIDTTGFAVTPGLEKTLWLPENHQFALDIPAAIKLTVFSDVTPTSIDALPKARLPTSQYQAELDIVAKRAFNLSSKTASSSKNKTMTGDQRKNKKMRVNLAGKKHRKSTGASSPLALYSYTASQLSDNGSTSSIDDDVAMEDMEETPVRYPVLEAEWAAGDPQLVAEDFLRMERENWKRSPALAQLGNQVTTMNAIRFAYQYHGKRSPLD